MRDNVRQAVDYLKTVGDTQDPIAKDSLRVFSLLTAQQCAPLWQVWQQIATDRRITLLYALHDLAESTPDFDFQQIFVMCLQDPDPIIRKVAIDGLWQEENSTILRQVLELANDDSDDVQAAVMLSLSHFAYLSELGEVSAEIAELVYTTLLHKYQDPRQSIDVKRRALESLAYFSHDPQIQTEIERAYAHPDQRMQESALLAMGRSLNTRWLPTLEQELSSLEPAMRYEAAKAVGEFAEEGRHLAGKLSKLTQDEDDEVALIAIWALGEIGGEQAHNRLKRLMQHTDEARSQAASAAMDAFMLFHDDSLF